MIQKMLGLPVSANPPCKYNPCKSTCRELFQEIDPFHPTLIGAHRVSNMICKSMSLKSQIRTSSCWDDTITSSNEVITDWEAIIAVGI